MYPHERTCRFPIFDGVALRKPRGRAMMMRFPGDVVVYPWIWGGQPTANLFLQLVTYDLVSAYILGNVNTKRLRTFELVYFNCQFLHQDYRTS